MCTRINFNPEARDRKKFPKIPIVESLIQINSHGYRDWASITDGQFVDFAKMFVEEKGIKNRTGLAKADVGLYKALRTRGLLDAVFAPIEQKKQDELLIQLKASVDLYTKSD